MAICSAVEQCDPKVSVVLPVRNGLPYLPAAVDSILSQTYSHFELIAVNDRSTDKTSDWLAARASQDHRLRFVTNPGAGLVDALNHGISQARGAYIARMDADDIAMPERFERQVAFLEANKTIAVLGTQIVPIDENGDLAGKPSAFPTEPMAVSLALIEKGCVFRHPTIMARRDALVAIGGYRSALVYAEDFDLWLRMAERYQLANLPEALLFYRQHPNSVSFVRQLEQQMAHSLALLSAQRRRMGLSDPIGTENAGGARGVSDDLELVRLVEAHSALKEFAAGSRSKRVVNAVLDAIERGGLHHGKRFLVSILAVIRQNALNTGDLSVAWRGLKLSLQIDPLRTLKSLRPISGGSLQIGGLAYEA